MKLLANQFSNSSPSILYHTCNIDDIYNKRANVNDDDDDDDFENDTNAKGHLNMDKFNYFVFNQMVLFIFLPAWSMITKILVVCGCIIAIQFGLCGTIYLYQLWKLPCLPGLPLPVITFSIYAMILNVIMKYANNHC